MSDGVNIRREGRAGCITLTRPDALNALSYTMCLAIDAALRDWAEDDAVALVLIDAEGTRAFCAGGDIAQMYATGRAGDYSYGRRFWVDEYRMNARIARYRKPVVSFLQGFTMGGGVGLGCHTSHRIVGATSQIAMPECSIGLVPDVGGTKWLAQAPGHLGAYLGLTGARMAPGDAIRAGFADFFLPEAQWQDLKAALRESGDLGAITPHPAPEAELQPHQAEIDHAFGAPRLEQVLPGLEAAGTEFSAKTAKAIRRNAPLSVACTLEMLRRLGPDAEIEDALAQELRFTWRSMEQGDFIEGIRAAIIDKDRNPRWRHARAEDVTGDEVAAMLAPLGADELQLDLGEEADA